MNISAFVGGARPPGQHAHDAAQPDEPEGVVVQERMDAAAAARLLRDRNVHRLIVTDEWRQKIIGFLTERDIVISVVAREADPRTLRVGDMMTRLDPPLARAQTPLLR